MQKETKVYYFKSIGQKLKAEKIRAKCRKTQKFPILYAQGKSEKLKTFVGQK